LTRSGIGFFESPQQQWVGFTKIINGSSMEIGGVVWCHCHWWRGLELQPNAAVYWVAQKGAGVMWTAITVFIPDVQVVTS